MKASKYRKFSALIRAMEIDGSILEGGGQILRNCIAYSAILDKPISIVKIRLGRDKPGLARQHLTGLQLAADLSGAETKGFEKESLEISFTPKGINHGHFVGNIGSAGACTLLAQISLPIALFGSGCTTLLLKGGTNVPFSPPVEYLQWVFLPTLRKFGVEGIEIASPRFGFTPSGGGEVNVKVQPTEGISAADLHERGSIIGCTAFVTGICTLEFENGMREAIGDLHWKDGDMKMVFNVARTLKDKGSLQVLFVVETDNGHCLGGSAIGGKKSTPKKLVTAAFSNLSRQLGKEICVDEYLQDQVVIFMALARGTSRMKCGDITLHTKTAIHFATLMTGAVFEIQEVEQGVNIVSCTGTSVTNKSIDKIP